MTWDLQEEAKWIMDRMERRESPDPELDRLSHSVLTTGKAIVDSIDRLSNSITLRMDKILREEHQTFPRKQTMDFLDQIKESLIKQEVLKEGNNEDH